MAFVGLVQDGDVEREIAVARYIMNPDGESCEFAIVVADAWQHKGIGLRLMQMLIEAARRRGFKRLEGEVLAENTVVQRRVRELGFEVLDQAAEPDVKRVTKSLFPGGRLSG